MVMQVPGLSQGEGLVEVPSFKTWEEWEHKEGPNRRLEKERGNLRKMMYMWGKKRVNEVVENKEESKAKTKIKEKKNRKQKDPNFNYCTEEVTMVIRRVLGSSYKFQSRKEKQKKHGHTKKSVPLLGGTNEIPSEVPQKKKVRTSERNKKRMPRDTIEEQGMEIVKGTLGNRIPKKDVVAESNSAMMNNGFEDGNSDPVLHFYKEKVPNFLFTTKEGITVMPGDFQGGGPAPGSSCLQVANYILLV